MEKVCTAQWVRKKSASNPIPLTESAALVEVDGYPVVIGGYDEEVADGDTEEDDTPPTLASYCWDEEAKAWVATRHPDVPRLEGLGCVAVARGTALLHGGLNVDYEATADVFKMSVERDESGNPRVVLDPVQVSGELQVARAKHGVCGSDGGFAVFGGLDRELDESSDLYVFHCGQQPRWERLGAAAGDGPPARFNCSLAKAGQSFFVFAGGSNQTGDLLSLADLWEFSPASSVWRAIAVACSPRNGHVSSVLPGTRILVTFGGACGASSGGGDTGSYDDRPLLVDLRTGASRALPNAAGCEHPVGLYMPAGAMSTTSPGPF
ncbi:hypothetical protein DIPPA_25283 [Diplonema papillatum]|nr:hypothetical protein DIPPA_25283 [Diplonema papillatum]